MFMHRHQNGVRKVEIKNSSIHPLFNIYTFVALSTSCITWNWYIISANIHFSISFELFRIIIIKFNFLMRIHGSSSCILSLINEQTNTQSSSVWFWFCWWYVNVGWVLKKKFLFFFKQIFSISLFIHELDMFFGLT